MSYDPTHVKKIMGSISVYWINLDRCKDRKKRLEKILTECNINNTRICAVDGENLDGIDKEYNFNDKCSIYEIACAISHLKAIKKAFDDGNEWSLIIEDDVNFEYLQYHQLPLN